MSGIGLLSLYGKSGYKYTFEIYTFGAKLEPEPAVYVVTRRYMPPGTTGHRHTIIYIGHTDDVSFNFEDHKRIKCFNAHGANCICIHRDEKSKSRKSKTKDLADRIRPKCNIS